MTISVDTNIDWKELLLKILHCFGEQEGTWYSSSWCRYGISDVERLVISKCYEDKYPDADEGFVGE